MCVCVCVCVCVCFKLFTCLQYEDDSRQRKSVDITYVGLNFPTTMGLVGPSALGCLLTIFGPLPAIPWRIQLNTASTGACDTLH